MKTWFISDTHFGHTNIIEYCERPFLDIEEHDEILIKKWNNTVAKGDRVYHLGDFGLAPAKYLIDILKKLNGQIHLIKGNHDRLTSDMKRLFISLNKIKEIKIKDEETNIQQRIVMCHYPMYSWNAREHGSWMLHGHCHGGANQKYGRLDVGVDCNDFSPISYNEIKTIFNKQRMTK